MSFDKRPPYRDPRSTSAWTVRILQILLVIAIFCGIGIQLASGI